jgi:2-polyprenyl-6-methoxyphenol hydroxylase-like FAD-dependent oxidoreductase
VIAGQPLIEVRWEHEAVGIEQDDDAVQVTCATPDGQVTLTASHVLACAGARGSTIRDLLGVSFEGRSFDDAFLICDIEAELPGWEHERRFYFDPVWNPGRQVLIHARAG